MSSVRLWNRPDAKGDTAYYNWSLAYKLQGKKAEAIANIEKSIALTDSPQLIEMARREIEGLSE